ncbi:ABC transporter ATP-binding protein, partial [bacterium]
QGGNPVVALDHLNLEISRGELLAITGKSGCGKSTLLNIIGGLDSPDQGQVRINGEDITRMDDRRLTLFRRDRVGIIFQFFNLLQTLTAEENVQTALMFSATPEKEQKRKARQLLSLLGLSDKLKAKPSELSGGQQQRVAVARALANDPEILLMDEPTGNLDSESEAEVLANIFALPKEGKTVVIVTHNKDIAKMAETIFEIKDGRLARS